MRECITKSRPSAAPIRQPVRGLPFLKILLGLRQIHDVGGGILKRGEIATAGKRNRIVEGAFPIRLWSDGQRRIPSVA
jgi:hypothetical protein